MATNTITFTTPSSTHPLLFLRPNHPHRQNHHTTTVTFRNPTSHRRFKKPYLLKPQTALLPLPPIPFPTFSPSFPTKQTLETLFAVSKRVALKFLDSAHEFKEPLISIANAAGKWVDLYHSVLIVRILLSWFPNMPWEIQPFSAIRDLCDPCLNFFRTIMPPSTNSNKIDLSPLLAFAVLGVLGNFLKTNVPPPV